MISEANLAKMRNVIAQHGGADSDALSKTLDDLETAITSQALVMHEQIRRLNNFIVDSAEFDQIMTENSLGAALGSIGRPKQNSFSMDDVSTAVQELKDAVDAANNFANILGTAVNVAKVFI